MLFSHPIAAVAPFPACPTVDATNRTLVARGANLFTSSTAFSQKGPFPACATCHNTAKLTDNKNHTVAPTGDTAVTFRRSTPSLRQKFSETGPYLWDQRASCLQKQIFGAIISPLEMGGQVPADASGQARIDAITAFLLSLRPPAPLTGLDAAAVARGKAVFDAKPCAVCHSGPSFTDNQLHNHLIGDGDPGALLVGLGGADEFDTPQLRGVRVSAPYFHDGRNGIPVGSSTPVATTPRGALRQVVEFYNDSRGLNLTAQQMSDLVEFLMSL